ncbi:MarR family winged helix-turn-helix transcriptional regulator [Halobacillus yeomjeoni]|uniref:MarR family transcriptional regulator n=1 Tax=Halobacillus yeomjeoni TaxID=311194 RepID=A0A931HYJ6_9BACI|nr:MarR family transcriptional regulator [Halobacillus yeomjeoni]MBH0231581.1 MarR family transcriptional regulator [Halobacillus yeomjeoni]
MEEQNFKSHLGYNIHMVSHFLQNAYNEKLGEYGLTHSQAKVIYYLANHGQQTQTDLQKKLHIKASSMNGVIDSLLKHERIKKRSSSKDKRSKEITLTPSGEDLYDRIVQIIQSMEEQLSYGLTEQEKEVMVATLKKMKDRMQPVSTGREQS